ncbi:MAG: glycosyltransferase family 2 protein [Edaphobacter sp.]|uniref:glycosyltransferase family 2 protein n=1 Tax=Edaphobacter sp. TaxID=1934404 RepID=UPI00239DF73D|nr:glycosyltransferase family 2 protein [Edaphobacter sp.]MDE1178839.1 glycosyltransferase family 2 protein [Edaphobacter sp.]
MSHVSSLAICICTRHRAQDLRKALQSIADSPRRPDQVIVSDDGQDGRTSEAVVAEFPFAAYQRGPRIGLGANRNACLASVRTAFVCFIDDDVVLPPSFVPLAYRLCEVNAEKLPQPLVSGIEFKHVSSSECFRVEPHNADFWGYQRVKPAGELKAMVINAGIFPMELFRKAQFDPLLRYGSEEIDMIRHAASLGYRVEFEPELWVDHYPSPVNREEYASVVDASRMYTTAKDYLRYQKNVGRFLLFSMLAPPKLALALTRRYGFKGLLAATKACVLTVQYGIRSSL